MEKATGYTEPTRPYMTGAELQTHHVGRNGRDYTESDDGWTDMEAETKRGWTTLSTWGRDGWDLGDWPYVSFQVRKHDGSKCDPICKLAARGSDFCPSFELQQIVEGDRDRYAFDTESDLSAALDYLFLWYSCGESWSPITPENREHLETGALRIDPKYRGSFSWARLDADKASR